MLRKLSVLAALCWLLLAPPVFAVGLGEIVVRSTLNQPFSASIPLINVSPAEAEELRVSLASSEAFAQAGIERLDYLSSLRFEVRTQGISSRISIISSQVARDPFLNFLIDVRVGDDRFQREYIVLLDPPGAADAEVPDSAIDIAPAVAAPVPAEPAPRAAPAEPPPSAAELPPAPAAFSGVESRERYGPVKNGESFWSIASRLRPPPPATLDQTMLAIFEINPQAFPGGIDSLRKGSTLKVPTAERVAASDPAMARDRLRELRGLPPLPREESAASDTSTSVAETEAPEDDAAPPVPESTDAADSALSATTPEFPPATPDESAQPVEDAAPSPKPSPQLRLKNFALPELPALPFDTSAVEKLPLDLLLVALFVLLILLLILVMLRRRERERTEVPPMQRMIPSSAVVAAAGRQGGNGQPSKATETLRTLSAETLLAEPQPAAVAAEPPAAAIEPPVSDAAETVAAAAPATMATTTTGDPLADADFNLAYGHYNEAIALLTEAIAQEPDRKELQLKLAETYFGAGRRNKFQQLAANLQPRVSAAEWERLAGMGRQLLPEAALFEPTVEPQAEPEAPAAAVAGHEQVPLVVSTTRPIPAEPPASASGPRPMNLLELDLKNFDIAKPAAKPAASERPAGFDEIRLEDFDLDADEPAEAESISDGDESGTKLDLARAYADMGDNDMARSLLTEVLALGNADQQQEAQTLLARLKS